MNHTVQTIHAKMVAMVVEGLTTERVANGMPRLALQEISTAIAQCSDNSKGGASNVRQLP